MVLNLRPSDQACANLESESDHIYNFSFLESLHYYKDGEIVITQAIQNLGQFRSKLHFFLLHNSAIHKRAKKKKLTTNKQRKNHRTNCSPCCTALPYTVQPEETSITKTEMVVILHLWRCFDQIATENRELNIV